MASKLETKFGIEPIPRKLDDKTLARLEKTREYWRKKLRPYSDSIRRASMLTEKDYDLVVNY